jgi:hypothetical protein
LRSRGGKGNFTSFGLLSNSGANVAFLGNGAAGQQGIYILTRGVREKVLDLKTPLVQGKTIQSLILGNLALDGTSVAFEATFTD